MPARNRVKCYAAGAYYHVYNRGVEKRRIFMDEDDYAVYLNLLKRYLSPQPTKDSSGRLYDSLHDEAELLAYCLMPNHFHLLFYQINETAITRLIQRVNTTYTMYFNKKYQRVGHLFQDCYKASLILHESYLLHISRYIHLNPKSWRSWPYSSLPYYLGRAQSGWVRPERLLEAFQKDDYFGYVADYEESKAVLDEIKTELAHC